MLFPLTTHANSKHHTTSQTHKKKKEERRSSGKEGKQVLLDFVRDVSRCARVENHHHNSYYFVDNFIFIVVFHVVIFLFYPVYIYNQKTIMKWVFGLQGIQVVCCSMFGLCLLHVFVDF